MARGQLCEIAPAHCIRIPGDSLTNFRAQKTRENLRREKGAEEIKRAFEKTEGRWEKKGTVPFCFGM